MSKQAAIQTADIRYIDGLKQNHIGSYYLCDWLDDRGNIKKTDKLYMELNSNAAEITVNMKDQGSGNGHYWIVSAVARKTIFCGKMQCNICREYHPEEYNLGALLRHKLGISA